MSLVQNGSADRYLHAVQMLSEKYCCVRSVDVAHYLRCSKASVSVTVRQLTEKGLLTAAGVDPSQAESEAFSLARAVSRDTFEKLRAHLPG